MIVVIYYFIFVRGIFRTQTSTPLYDRYGRFSKKIKTYFSLFALYYWCAHIEYRVYAIRTDFNGGIKKRYTSSWEKRPQHYIFLRENKVMGYSLYTVVKRVFKKRTWTINYCKKKSPKFGCEPPSVSLYQQF